MNCRPLSNCVLFFFCGCSFVGSGVFGVHRDCGVLPPTHFSIQSLSDFVAGLSDELLLCPVCALSEYVARTSRVVHRPWRPFVSSCYSSRVISKKKRVSFSCCEKSFFILTPAPGMLRGTQYSRHSNIFYLL